MIKAMSHPGISGRKIKFSNTSNCSQVHYILSNKDHDFSLENVQNN